MVRSVTRLCYATRIDRRKMRENTDMSRGWESKSVESQMEEAALRRGTTHQIPLTPEQIRVRAERQSLELSRTRVLKDLESAVHPRRRAQLEAGLRYLDEKLAALP
jgi:hypothetical protein